MTSFLCRQRSLLVLRARVNIKQDNVTAESLLLLSILAAAHLYKRETPVALRSSETDLSLALV
jgi:hypothetical protein